MQSGMLHTSVIPVNWQPIFHFIRSSQSGVIVRIAVADIIPIGTSPIGHRVSFAHSGFAALRASGVYPISNCRQGRGTIASGLIFFHIRKFYRQLIFGNRNRAALRTMDNWNWFSPIMLARKYPVA